MSCQNYMIFFIYENLTPLIDIPIRVTPTSAPFHEHIYVKFIENFYTGVLQTNIIVTTMLLSAMYQNGYL